MVDQISSTHVNKKAGMGVMASNSSSGDTEAGRSLGQLARRCNLVRELEMPVGYCLKKQSDRLSRNSILGCPLPSLTCTCPEASTCIATELRTAEVLAHAIA